MVMMMMIMAYVKIKWTFAVLAKCTAATRVLPKLTSRCRMISVIVPRIYLWKSLYSKLEDESTTNTTSAILRHSVIGSVTN